MAILSNSDQIPLRLGRDLINITTPYSLEFVGKHSEYCTVIYPRFSQPFTLTVDGSTSFYKDIELSSGVKSKSVGGAPNTTYQAFIGNTYEDGFNLIVGDKDSLTSFGVWSIHWPDTEPTPYLSYTNLNFLNEFAHLTRFGASGYNLFKFDISTIPTHISSLSIYNDNPSTAIGVYGNISTLPSNITTLALGDHNIVAGNVSDIPATLEYLYLDGYNTLTGNVSNIPATLKQLDLFGYNTVTGNFADLPATLKELWLGGNNTLSGALSTLTNSAMEYIFLDGNNSVSGDIANLPQKLIDIQLYGNNTITGDVSSFNLLNTANLDASIGPSGLVDVVRSIQIGGNNTVGGDLFYLPGTLGVFFLESNAPISYSQTGKNRTGTYLSFGITDFRITASTGFGLSSASVDNLLIDLAIPAPDNFYGGPSYPYRIWLIGDHQPRTAASDTAYNTLVAAGVDVSVA